MILAADKSKPPKIGIHKMCSYSIGRDQLDAQANLARGCRVKREKWKGDRGIAARSGNTRVLCLFTTALSVNPSTFMIRNPLPPYSIGATVSALRYPRVFAKYRRQFSLASVRPLPWVRVPLAYYKCYKYFSLPVFDHKVRIKLLPIYHSYLRSKKSDRTHVRPKSHPNVLHNRFLSSS